MGILVWLIFTIADAIDELLIDTDCLLGAFAMIAVPLILFVHHIIYYVKHKPNWKGIVAKFTGFSLVSLILWFVIYVMIENNTYIVYQKDRSEWLNLNGIEYMFYGFPVIGGFIILSLIFHGILFIKHKIVKGEK